MSSQSSEFAVIVKDVYWNEQHYQRHCPSHYVASIITNCQGGEMTEDSRSWYFAPAGNGEKMRYLADDEAQAKKISERFNRLWSLGIYQSLSKLTH